MSRPYPWEPHELLSLDHPKFVHFQDSLPVLVVEKQRRRQKGEGKDDDGEKAKTKRQR
jgi:hypothetical protein